MRSRYIKTLLLALSLIFTSNLMAQHDYYIKNGISTFGIKIYNRSDAANAKSCVVKNYNKIIEYSPQKVDEYGFKSGKTYLSKTITIDNKRVQVFLQRMVDGKMSLFYFKGEKDKLFFLEKDSSTLIPLPNTGMDNLNYQTILKDNSTGCEEVAKTTGFVEYNKKSLSRFIENLNDCQNKPLPFFKYGILSGISFNRTYPSRNATNKYLNLVEDNYQGSLMIGAFIDNPIFINDFSLHLEAYYTQNSFSYTRHESHQDIDLIVNTKSLNFPILLRYSYPSYKFLFFINAGGLFTYNIKNESDLYNTSINQSVIEIDHVYHNNLISETQIGYSMGGGIQINITYKNAVLIEIRYNSLYNFEYSPSMLNSNILQLITSISF